MINETKTRGIRRQLCHMLGLCIGVGLACAASAQTQAGFPSKPMRLIAPTTAGAPHDLVSRLIAERLAPTLGQPVIVDNQPGASGVLAITKFIQAAPDGHTLALVFMPQAIQQALIAKAPYDMARDIAPVILLGWDFNILVVHPSVPARSVAELIAYLKANPGKLNFGSGGSGSPAHVFGESFKQATGTQMTHVPFKGVMPAVQDLLAGRVQVMIGLAPAVMPHIRSGALRPLAAAAPKRLPAVPDVPSFAEVGYPELAGGAWFGIAVPAGTSAGIVARLNRDIAAITAAAELRSKIAAGGGAEITSSTPEEFRAIIAADLERWRRVVRQANLKAD